jgi:hypothetical protein
MSPGWQMLLRFLVAGTVVTLVVELAPRLPRVGALILTLPIISIFTFIFTWLAHRQIETIAGLSRETLVLVPLGLVFFVPLALADRWRLDFWVAFAAGIVLAAIVLALWVRFGPRLA